MHFRRPLSGGSILAGERIVVLLRTSMNGGDDREIYDDDVALPRNAQQVPDEARVEPWLGGGVSLAPLLAGERILSNDFRHATPRRGVGVMWSHNSIPAGGGGACVVKSETPPNLLFFITTTRVRRRCQSFGERADRSWVTLT